MSLFVVSDLHIAGGEDPLYAALNQLIRERVQGGDTLVLAGDVFDLFVGNKAIFLDRYRGFVETLRDAGVRGVKMHYIEGNHDFLIRRAFHGIPGLTVHAHDVRLELAGKRFFVAHGDTVDRSDYGYRFLRAFFRSPLMKAFVTLVPGETLDWIGRTSSRKSSEATPRLPTALPVDRLQALRKAYRNYAAERLTQGYDFVVMGHCHDLDEMCFHIGGRHAQYVNVGYPRVHGTMLTWTPGDEKIQRESISAR